MAKGPGRSPLGGEREDGEAAQLDLGLCILQLEAILADRYTAHAARVVAARLLPQLRAVQADWSAHLERLNRLIAAERRQEKE